ncbi:MAG: hypothetical protein ACOWWM_05040 [Desulfobacterales bacterium]
MDTKERRPIKERFVFVKDRDGNEFVCPIDSLKNPEELTEDEKAACMDAAPPRGLVSSPF